MVGLCSTERGEREKFHSTFLVTDIVVGHQKIHLNNAESKNVEGVWNKE